MTDILSAPIPGQSLTDTPKNYPWERPPEITDPRKAVKHHLEGINKPETIDNLVELMQLGMPVRVISKTILTSAQMAGIHSVDVSLIIGDVVYEELVTIAEEAGLDYRTGDEPDKFEVKEREEQSTLAMLRKKLNSIEPGSEEDDAGVEIMRQSADMLEGGTEEEDTPMMGDAEVQEEEEMPTMEAEAPRGLMARG